MIFIILEIKPNGEGVILILGFGEKRVECFLSQGDVQLMLKDIQGTEIGHLIGYSLEVSNSSSKEAIEAHLAVLRANAPKHKFISVVV